MTAEQATETPAAEQPGTDANREQSTIRFPYGDLDDATEVTKGVHSVGGSGCELTQLAGHLQMTATGGGFRQRLLTAKTFGLVTYGRETITLTPLGSRLVDPKQEPTAKAHAFLSVPLYKAVYDEYKSGVLPPTNDALENAMVKLGVASKQKDKARQTFQRSARQAGFFWAGSDRLVMPKGSAAIVDEPPADVDDIPKDDATKKKVRKNDDGGADGGPRHPFIAGLLKELPAEGQDWATEDRVKWLQAAAMIFDLIYKNGNGKSQKIDVSSSAK